MLKDKKIIIGVSGSIAAYKIPYLIRLLVKEGAQVQVLLTPSARDFVTPLTLSPWRMAALMGEAPLQRGSREAWTLIHPKRGKARSGGLRI